MRIIAYSLFGKSTKYLIGAIENAKLANTIYPGWISRYYVSESVPIRISNKLTELGSEVILVKGADQYQNTLWRFKSFSDNNVEYAISRDCDSRLSFREAQAVNEWINSKKIFHIMRDHPSHQHLILGGMCGAKGGVVDFDILWNNANENRYGVDQDVLARYIYPIIRNKSFVHDSFFKYEINSKHFPSERINGEFIGEIIDENGNINKKDRLILIRAEKSAILRAKFKIKHILNSFINQ